MLEAWLEFHRTTLLLKCEGLDDAARKRRPVPTSKLSLHGLIRHMAEVERGWFRRTLLGEDAPRIWMDTAVDDLDLVPIDDADWDDGPRRLDGRVRSEPRRRGRPRTRRQRSPRRRAVHAALDLRAHDRGVRAPQRARGPDPRDGRRQRRLVAGRRYPGHVVSAWRAWRAPGRRGCPCWSRCGSRRSPCDRCRSRRSGAC